MIHLTASTPILVATEAADFRCGIDGLAARVQHRLGHDPRSGTLYVFRNRGRTMIRILAYEACPHEPGRGYWLLTKRLSRGRFAHWPHGASPLSPMAAHQLRQVLSQLVYCADE
jgi:transposase